MICETVVNYGSEINEKQAEKSDGKILERNLNSFLESV